MIPKSSALGREVRVVNVGLALFADTLDRLGVPVAHLDWRPPAGGDARLGALLARLDACRERIDRANETAFDRLVNGEPVLVDCVPASQALGLGDRVVLHA